jgi:small conductance mechanosensitive channel
VNVVRKATFLVGLVVALSMLEVNIGPFLAAIGAAGFIIGFALQGTLSNFAAGIMILLYRPYDIGDFVNVAGVSGTVSAMTLVSTTLKLPDNQTVVIPNNSIWGDIITNVTGSETRRVDMVFGIGYDDDIAKAQGILEKIVKDHPLVLGSPEAVVRVNELADSSVNFVCRPWAKTSDYWTVYWDITRQVKEQFDQNSISIPFPQRDVHVHQISA